jgi:hypothetical protein
VKQLRQRIFWILLMVAWLALGIVMTVWESYIFAGVAYLIAAFYLGREIWWGSRRRQFQQAMTDMKGDRDIRS